MKFAEHSSQHCQLERERERAVTGWSMDPVRNPIIKDLIIFKYGHFLRPKLSPNVFTLSNLTCQMGEKGRRLEYESANWFLVQ